MIHRGTHNCYPQPEILYSQSMLNSDKISTYKKCHKWEGAEYTETVDTEHTKLYISRKDAHVMKYSTEPLKMRRMIGSGPYRNGPLLRNNSDLMPPDTLIPWYAAAMKMIASNIRVGILKNSR